jgi:hypothetical protein
MSYIINNANPFVSIKLTEIGRQNLALGQLTFSFWGLGDSEINYGREEMVTPTNVAELGLAKTLKPVDQQPNIKYYVKRTNTTDNLNVLRPNADKQVIKAIANNKATERGFFSQISNVFTTLSASTYSPYSQLVSNSQLNGTTTLNLTTTTNIAIGDVILLKLANTKTGNVVPFGNTKPIPNLWYKVQSKTPTSITVDREFPNVSSESVNSQVIVYKGGEISETIGNSTTTAYWDSGTLSFNANNNVTCNDVPVWNMNNVWCENLAGMTGLTTTINETYTNFGSQNYLGQMNPYLGYFKENLEAPEIDCTGLNSSYLDKNNKSISILHYTNNSISSLYGEFLHIDTTQNKVVEVELPDLMYHRRNYSTGSGTTMGMKFVSSGTEKRLTDTSDITYHELIEDITKIASGETPKVVGRVFPQLKIIVFHDDEIVSAISYKANRNWTLPELAANLVAPSGGTSTGSLSVGETMYMTYVLERTGASGLTTSLPCQTYIKITNSSSTDKDVSFRINGTDQLPYMRKRELAGDDGFGFHAHKFKLVYQKVADINTRPNPEAWKVYDFTSTDITGTVNQTINPKLLETQNPTAIGFILDLPKHNTATTFSIIDTLRMASVNTPQNLQFGDERIFYGNINTHIGATIFKTIFNLTISPSEFAMTSNPTRSTDVNTNPPTIRVSEVGIYDDNRNLVCIGKLSSPIPLVDGVITLELSVDF